MKHPILKATLALAVVAAAGLAAILLIDRTPSYANEGVSPIVTPAGLTPVQRGEYLTVAADCVACHTVPGGKEFVGGLPFRMPWDPLESTCRHASLSIL